MNANCSSKLDCSLYAECVRGYCRCESGFAPTKNHPELCKQPTCDDEFCLRCFASQECTDCADSYSFLDPESKKCAPDCPEGKYSLVFDGAVRNKVCKQGWTSYRNRNAQSSLSSAEIVIISVSCCLAVALMLISIGFLLFYQRRKARRQTEAIERAQMRLNGNLPSIRNASRRQSYAVSDISSTITACRNDSFDFVANTAVSLFETNQETRMFLAHVGILRPHLLTFRAMLKDLERWILKNKKSRRSSKKLFRHRSFDESAKQEVGYGVSRTQLKRIIVILERYPLVTVDPQEGCKLLRWGQECLRRFLATSAISQDLPAPLLNNRMPNGDNEMLASASLRSERSPREDVLLQRSSSSLADYLTSAKKRPPLKLTTFCPDSAGLEKIVEDENDNPLINASDESVPSAKDVRKTNSFHGQGNHQQSTAF